MLQLIFNSCFQLFNYEMLSLYPQNNMLSL